MLYRIQEDHPIMSFSVSDDGRHILINVASQVCMFKLIAFRCYSPSLPTLKKQLENLFSWERREKGWGGAGRGGVVNLSVATARSTFPVKGSI